MKLIKNWIQFKESLDDPNKVIKIRKGYEGKQTDVKLLSEITNLSIDQIIKIIRYDLKHDDVADYLEKKFNKQNKSLNAKGKIVYEMTGSPRLSMKMLPPKERTKSVFDAELSKHGYSWGTLNKKCDLLVTDNLENMTVKMKKAKEMGIEITTYDALIKKLKLFKNNENFDMDEGQLILNFDNNITKWNYLTDVIQNGILENSLDLNSDDIEEFGNYLQELDGEEYEYFSIDDLTQLIEEEFENYLDKLFDWMIDKDLLENKPSITIKGKDDNGERYNLSYYTS